MSQAELLISTRIRDVKVDPTRVVVGGTVTVTGIAEHLLPWPWGWQPLNNVEVGLIVDNTKVDAKITSADGGFQFTRQFNVLGTHWVKVRFDGDLLHDPCESYDIQVTVITEDQKKEEEQSTLITFLVAGAIACTFIIALASVLRG